MKGINVLFTPEEFKQKGFAGEIATKMRENENTAIVGDNFGTDRHIVEFTDYKTLNNYRNNNPYEQKNIKPTN